MTGKLDIKDDKLIEVSSFMLPISNLVGPETRSAIKKAADYHDEARESI